MAATVSTTISSPTGWQLCIKNVSLEIREQTLQRESLHVVSLVAGFRYKTREIRSKVSPTLIRKGSDKVPLPSPLPANRYMHLAIKDYCAPPPLTGEGRGLLIQDDVHNGEGIRDGNLAVTIHIGCIEDKEI